MSYSSGLRRPLLALALALSTSVQAGASAELDQLLGDIVQIRREEQLPGVALTLVDPSMPLWSGGVGFADLSASRPATPDTLYRVDALSGTLTALATMLAVERGRLSLDTPVRALLPDLELRNPWRDTHPVRLAHLLEHTAGLPEATGAGQGAGPAAVLVQWPPGLFPSPSAAGEALAGAALESAVGQSRGAFLERHLLEPLGMHRSGFRPDAAAAGAYDADGTPLPPAPAAAQGSLISTPRELARLLQLLLDRGATAEGRLLEEASVWRLETPRTSLGAQQGLTYGQAPGNVQWIHRGFLFHGAAGEAGGHLSRYGYSRELGAGFAVIINARKPQALQRLSARIQDHLVGGRTPHRPQPAAVEPGQLLPLGGNYRAMTWRSAAERAAPAEETLQVLPIGRRLYLLGAGGTRQELVPVSDRLFRRADEPLATTAFIGHGADVYLQTPSGNYLCAAEAGGADGLHR